MICNIKLFLFSIQTRTIPPRVEAPLCEASFSQPRKPLSLWAKFSLMWNVLYSAVWFTSVVLESSTLTFWPARWSENISLRVTYPNLRLLLSSGKLFDHWIKRTVKTDLRWWFIKAELMAISSFLNIGPRNHRDDKL